MRVTRAERLCPQLLRLGNDRCKLLAAQRGASRVRRRRPIGELPDRQRAGRDAHVELRLAVAGLRVARRAALRLPRGVALHHQAELAERLAVACRIAAVVDANPLVGAVALRKLVQEGDLRGLRHASDRGEAELGERHDEAVELADPVDHAVAAGVGHDHVATGPAKSEVLVGRVGIAAVVQPAVRGEDVVEVDEVVAPAAEDLVAASAAHRPVVAQIAEDAVVAVRRHAGIGCLPGDPMRVDRSLRGVEVQDPLEPGSGLRQRTRRREQDLAQRIVCVVERELGGRRVVAERVPRVERMEEVALGDGADLHAVRVVVGRVRHWQRFRARDRVIARSAVDRVVA